MAIEFRCPTCDKLLRTADDKAGLAATCPGCGSPVTVPSHRGDEPHDEFEVLDEPAAGHYRSSVPPLPRPESERLVTHCSACGGAVDSSATACPFCGESLRPHPSHVEPVEGVRPTGSQTLAVTALLTGIASLPFSFCCGCFALPLIVVSFVYGSMALAQIARGEAEGKPLAIAGMCCAGFSILLAIVMTTVAMAMQADLDF